MKAYGVSEVCGASRASAVGILIAIPWSSRRRQELLELLDRLDPSIEQLSQAVEQEYLGLVPCEDSSADRRRLGHIGKQGNAMLRHLLGQAAQSVARCDAQWHGQYAHLVRLFWMWRKEWDYQQLKKFGSHVGQLVQSHGVQ